MSSAPVNRPRGWREWQGWKPLTVACALSVALVAIVWWWNNDRKATAPTNAETQPLPRPPRGLPVPVALDVNEDPDPIPLVARDNFDGVPVLRIRAGSEGDDIIVDAATGKLLAVRDNRGKLTRWARMDDVPMTMSEPMIKGS
jgi:hypothetical protein